MEKEENVGKPLKKFSVSVSTKPTGKRQKEIIKKMRENVFGQDRAIRRGARAISIFEANLNDPRRPVGALMFAGPSGSGKTYTAKWLGYAWIGEPEKGSEPVVFIDCGSLSLEHERATLTGSPPGYVGYGEEVGLEQVGEYEKKKRPTKKTIIEEWFKQAFQRLRGKVANPQILLQRLPSLNAMYQEAEREEEALGQKRMVYRAVVIFDEFEKAHFNVQKQLLNLLEEGKLRLQNGRVIDFTGSLFVFTTNVGTQQVLDEYLSDKKMGFRIPAKDRIKKSNGMDKAIYGRVRREIESGGHFLPELLGRIGKPGIIVFQTLKHPDYLKILEVELFKVQKMLGGGHQSSPGKLFISYSQEFKDFLIEEGVEPKYGARAVKNVVDKYVKEPIANAILNGALKQNDRVLLKVEYNSTNGNGKEEGRKEGETKIFRQERSPKQEYPPFRFEKEEGPVVDRKAIERILNRELDQILGGNI